MHSLATSLWVPPWTQAVVVKDRAANLVGSDGPLVLDPDQEASYLAEMRVPRCPLVLMEAEDDEAGGECVITSMLIVFGMVLPFDAAIRDALWTRLLAAALELPELPNLPTKDDLRAGRRAHAFASIAATAVLQEIPPRPTAADLRATCRAHTFAALAAGAMLPEVPPLPRQGGWARLGRWFERCLRTLAARLRRRSLLLLLLSLVVACAGPAPQQRTLVVQGPGQFGLTLVYAGLHAQVAQQLLLSDAEDHGERLACPHPRATLDTAKEDTKPGKDEGAPPRSITTITGVLTCEVLR